MKIENVHDIQLAMELKKAMERKEFHLFYQPKLDLASGKIVGVEALIRWKHPEKGMISPMEFIPVAEKTGLIKPLGEWVLRTACEQGKVWREMGYDPLIMAVNLSAPQLYQTNLVEIVQDILEETTFAPECLELEITESMLMDVHNALPILKKLKKLGIRLSLDDFGTGYSSLYYLKELPIDIIKIDQSFVRNCTVDAKDDTIVKAIIAMAHQLKLEVIAEGIELKDHLIFLQRHFCNRGQGYLFSKPLPANELEHMFFEISKIIHREGLPKKISRQKWLEEELEHARQELRDTVKNQQGMIFKFIQKNGTFIHTLCDGTLLYRLGFTPEHIIGKELHAFLPRLDAEQMLHYYRRAWAGEEHVTYERYANGIWYLASLRPIRRGGQVVEVIGSCVNITERKESEEQFRKVVEYSPKGIVIHRDGHILYANPMALNIAHEKEMEGKLVRNYLHPDSYQLYEQRLSQAEVGKELPAIAMKLIRKDGETIDIEVVSMPIHYEGSPAILTILSDVTERKKAEEALRDSEEKYRIIAENAQDLIGILDANGVIQYASPSHKTVLGFSPEVYEGHAAFDKVHPEDIPYMREEYADAMLSKMPCSVQFRYKHANGKWVDLEAVGTPVLNGEGEVKNLVVVARNLSKRKKRQN